MAVLIPAILVINQTIENPCNQNNFPHDSGPLIPLDVEMKLVDNLQLIRLEKDD